MKDEAMTTARNADRLPIGTVVLGNDSFTTRLGQIADYETTRFGTFYVVLVGGEFNRLGFIGDADMRGIGWKVATAEEIARQRRYDEAFANYTAEHAE